MAGHSKWHNIKHRKAAVDARRGRQWSKCAKAIMVAAKNGGPDPKANLALQYAIDEARYANMPRDTIERAIKKGSGEIGGEDWSAVRYEGYGPRGVAIVVDALTNNRTRTATDIRNAFAKFGGNLGASGCVSFMFQARGVISLSAPGSTEDQVLELALAAGAQDVRPADDAAPDTGAWLILTAPTDFHAVKSALEQSIAADPSRSITDARIDLLPTTTVSLTGDDARTLIRLIEALEDNDDVQKVYANFEIPDEELAALEG